MNLFNYIMALLFVVQGSFAQIDKRNVAQVNVSTADTLTTVISHTMGDVNVQGYGGDFILAYAKESLPSFKELRQSTSNDIFEQLTALDFQERELQLRNAPEFNIEQHENVVIIKTNVYSFNTDIHVLTPYRSHIVVNVKDMGDISVKDVYNSVETNTKSGNIFLEDTDGIVSANTQNGNIVAKFKNERFSPLFMSTFVGNIEVIVPKTTNNSVLASSEMGNLYSNFSTNNGLSVNATSQHVKNRKISFNINKGGTEFVLYTFKGDIYLRYIE